MTQKPYTNKVY